MIINYSQPSNLIIINLISFWAWAGLQINSPNHFLIKQGIWAL